MVAVGVLKQVRIAVEPFVGRRSGGHQQVFRRVDGWPGRNGVLVHAIQKVVAAAEALLIGGAYCEKLFGFGQLPPHDLALRQGLAGRRLRQLLLVLRSQQAAFHDFLALAVIFTERFIELFAPIVGTFIFTERAVFYMLIRLRLQLLLQVFKLPVDGGVSLRVLLLLLDATSLHLIYLLLDPFDLLLDGNLRICQTDFAVVPVAATAE